MKKLLVSIFILSLVAMPSATHAGFFDFFKINQKAQVTSAVKSDNLVLQLQQSLTTLGLYSGKVDGVVGFRTTTAIKAFQRQNKLPVTGLLDRTTVDMILKNGGGSRDGGFFGVYDETPPSLSMLDYRCENSVPAFVRILSPWQGNSFVYEEDDVNIQVFVCDNTGVGNTHSLAIVSQGIDIDNNSAIEGTLELVGVFGDSYMTPYGQHSWLMNIPLGSDHFEPGHYSLLTSNEESYRINNIPQFGL
jgi:peptidoglycan hydrolase-like protein with peptidoglycan-binding domain